MTHSKCLTNEFFNKELFTVSEQEIEEFKQKFELQCPILYERFKDNVYYMTILKMMTIEQKNIYTNDYLLHVASEWRRDRIEYGDELRCICHWLPGKHRYHISNIPVIDHWNKLKEIEISPDNYSEFRSADLLVHVSLLEICEYHALYDPLIVPHSFQINDCLETTMKYICAAAEWIDDMIKKSKTSIFPLQIDLCVHYAATIDSNDDCFQFPTIDHGKKATTLQQFDDALKRYYNSMGVEYVNQFSTYAEENGYEYDDVVEEITYHYGQNDNMCMILDFDENIPLKQEFKNINDRENEIFNLLFKIYNDPDYDFKRPYNINQISIDRIGDIQKKLEGKKSKYACIECDSNGIFYSNEFIVCSWIRININLNQNVLYSKDIIFLLAKYVDDAEWSLQTQSFVKLFNKFTVKNNVKNKRFITFIDRRNSARNIDTLWMFEPFQCANIPNDAISYWYFNALKTFLLPNNINVDNANQCDDNKDTNALLLTFSFHVKSADSIKCFLYYKNGEMMQFMPKHIKNVLPKLFTANLNATFDGSVNVQFMENENVISQQITRINKILHDNPFDFRGIEK
eukprot:413306_1